MSTRTFRFDAIVSKLDAREELGDGSVRYQARLTRTGVFDYGDHKEARFPDEVFAPAALASFRGLTVTDGHRAHIDGENWRDFAVGHVGDDVRQDGDFVAASVVIKDAEMNASIASGKHLEFSMGYMVDLEPTEGELDGQKYDAVQRNIRGNHAAMGPANWGRAGRDVRLTDASYAPPVSIPASKNLARIDAPASNTDESGLRKDLETARNDADRIRAERDAATARADKAEAERDAAKTSLEAAEKKSKDDGEGFEDRVQARVQLVSDARAILGADFDFKGKSDRDIRIAAITKVDSKFDPKDKKDGYLEARFELAVPQVKADREELAKTNEITKDPKIANVDANESVVEKAAREMRERNAKRFAVKS